MLKKGSLGFVGNWTEFAALRRNLGGDARQQHGGRFVGRLGVTNRLCDLYRLTARHAISAATKPAMMYQKRRAKSVFTDWNMPDPISISMLAVLMAPVKAAFRRVEG